ncbi:uncharacterized protein LOC122506308 [Leptopilina heterotoma]|uniref:uncharacterized protein LOC122506308 n=1 Tax=Leptopilina heterotoma TaxID=63436 RepID=UPI001CAA0DE0|nr:uncharacterized protein LOC122506308 [Leptopilina heterotoma]
MFALLSWSKGSYTVCDTKNVLQQIDTDVYIIVHKGLKFEGRILCFNDNKEILQESAAELSNDSPNLLVGEFSKVEECLYIDNSKEAQNSTTNRQGENVEEKEDVDNKEILQESAAQLSNDSPKLLVEQFSKVEKCLYTDNSKEAQNSTTNRQGENVEEKEDVDNKEILQESAAELSNDSPNLLVGEFSKVEECLYIDNLKEAQNSTKNRQEENVEEKEDVANKKKEQNIIEKLNDGLSIPSTQQICTLNGVYNDKKEEKTLLRHIEILNNFIQQNVNGDTIVKEHLVLSDKSVNDSDFRISLESNLANSSTLNLPENIRCNSSCNSNQNLKIAESFLNQICDFNINSSQETEEAIDFDEVNDSLDPDYIPRSNGSDYSSDDESAIVENTIDTNGKSNNSLQNSMDSSGLLANVSVSNAPDDEMLIVEKANGSKGYGKKYCCVFCKKKVSKIARHLESVHKDEEDVKKFSSLTVGSETDW